MAPHPSIAVGGFILAWLAGPGAAVDVIVESSAAVCPERDGEQPQGAVEDISLLQKPHAGREGESLLQNGRGEAVLKTGPRADDADTRGPPGGGEFLDMDLLLADHESTCQTVFLTTFLGRLHKDPMRGNHVAPNFEYIERYYRSIMALPSGRAKAVILHDMLSENFTKTYTPPDETVTFVEANLSKYDRRLGNNDLRFLIYEDVIKEHPEWENVFLTDGQDVVMLHNPCALVEKNPGKLFVDSQEGDTLSSYTWMGKKFRELGGKYSDWYTENKHHHLCLNAGILGGRRKRVLEALQQINAVIMDPDNAARQRGKFVFSNMATFNYVMYTSFPDDIVTGHPLHSRWLRYENRTDVYMWHK